MALCCHGRSEHKCLQRGGNSVSSGMEQLDTKSNHLLGRGESGGMCLGNHARKGAMTEIDDIKKLGHSVDLCNEDFELWLRKRRETRRVQRARRLARNRQRSWT